MLYPRAVQRKAERRLLFTAAAVLLAFIVLVGALDRFQPTQGLRITTQFSNRVDSAFESIDRSGRSTFSGEGYSWVVSIVTGLSVILFLVGVASRRSRLSTLILIPLGALLFFVFSGLVAPPPETPTTALTQGDADEAGGPPPAHGTMDEEDAVSVTPERETGFSIWSVVFAAAATVALIILVRPRMQFRRKREESGQLARAAMRAVASAHAGDSVSTVIIACYREMMEIIETARGVKRKYAMTPREFAARLGEAGVAREHVEAITILFEKFRYGDIDLSPDDEAAALGHVQAISESLGR